MLTEFGMTEFTSRLEGIRPRQVDMANSEMQACLTLILVVFTGLIYAAMGRYEP